MAPTRQARRRRSGGVVLGLGLALIVVVAAMLPGPTSAFAPSSSARHVSSSRNIGSVSSSSAFLGAGRFRVVTPQSAPCNSANNRRKEGGMSMFLGQDSGILGVGAPEIVSFGVFSFNFSGKYCYGWIVGSVFVFHRFLTPRFPSSALPHAHTGRNCSGGLLYPGSYRIVQTNQGNWQDDPKFPKSVDRGVQIVRIHHGKSARAG